MPQSVQNLINTLVAVVPKLVVFLVILVIGWIVAKLLAKAVTKLLSLIGFDRAIERGGLRRWTGTYDPSQLFAKLVYYAVLLIALQMAFGVFGPNPVSDIINSIVAFLPLAFIALVIVVITAAIANAVKDVITGALGGLSYSRVLGAIAQVFILALGIIAALNQVGIAMTVTMPVLITVLATIGGVIVVGVGGGLIQPMRQRWERMLERVEGEASNAKAQLDANASQRQSFQQSQYASSQYAGSQYDQQTAQAQAQHTQQAQHAAQGYTQQ